MPDPASPVTLAEDLAFQNGARMADVGVATILARARAEGIDPRAIAAGALMAVVRFHLDHMGLRTERSLIRVISPALARTARDLIENQNTPDVAEMKRKWKERN